MPEKGRRSRPERRAERSVGEHSSQKRIAELQYVGEKLSFARAEMTLMTVGEFRFVVNLDFLIKWLSPMLLYPQPF